MDGTRSAVGTLRPPHQLVELAAGRATGDVGDPERLVRAAVAHRMTGVLWDAVSTGGVELPPDLELELAKRDLAQQGRQHALAEVLVRTLERLDRMEVDVALLKGFATQTCFYERPAQRPFGDIDLWLAPHDVARVSEVIEELQPDHPLRSAAGQLCRDGHVQSIDLRVGGANIDLHVDPLKLDVPSRVAEEMWARTERVVIPHVGSTRVLDPVAAFLLQAVHIYKDRFSYLLHLGDLVRIGRTHPDWQSAADLARRDGIGVIVERACRVVNHELGVTDLPTDWSAPDGWHAAVAGFVTAPSVRLQGDLGCHRHRRRQVLAPLAMDRPLPALLSALVGRLLPPRPLVDAYLPDSRGPYLLRLVVGRLGEVRRRRSTVRSLATRSTSREVRRDG